MMKFDMPDRQIKNKFKKAFMIKYGGNCVLTFI